MEQRATIDKALQYIRRKLYRDASGNEVLSRHYAELSAKIAFDGGRQSILDNVTDLKWCEFDGRYYAPIAFGGYIIYPPEESGGKFNLEIGRCFMENCMFASLGEAQNAANEDYRQRLRKALQL
jgi:hypothetical protein|nr:MAG TPA: hypothetical protein [Caudoviricetes sp.]